jgi:phage baseplate assembly protein gpV
MEQSTITRVGEFVNKLQFYMGELGQKFLNSQRIYSATSKEFQYIKEIGLILPYFTGDDLTSLKDQPVLQAVDFYTARYKLDKTPFISFPTLTNIIRFNDNISGSPFEWSLFPALGNVNIANFNINNIGNSNYTTNITVSPFAEGQLQWNQDEKTFSAGVDTDIDISLGREYSLLVQASEDIDKGEVVYISNSDNDNTLIATKFIADGSISNKYILGIAKQDILSGETGNIVVNGKLKDIDTSSFSVFNTLYVSSATAGALVNTEPIAPNYKIPIAYVVKDNATTGTIQVNAGNIGYNISDLFDINISSISDNDVLKWNDSNSRWENIALTTTNVAEGDNLYFTIERVQDEINNTIQNGTGISWVYDDGVGTYTPTITLSPFDTSDLSEGSNLYFTDERAQDALASAFAAGTTTRISIGYVDGSNLFNFTVDDDLSNYDNTTTAFISNLNDFFTSNGILVRQSEGTFTSRTITGTTNEITVTNGDGVFGNPTISLPSSVITPGDLTVTGDLIVNGTTASINVTNLETSDPLIHGADENPANTLDLGAYWSYNFGTTEEVAGIFRDVSATGKPWTFFEGLQDLPTTSINTAGTGYALSSILAKDAVFGGTGAVTLASGTTAQRPTATNGMIRYNTTNDKLEGYEAAEWKDLITAATGTSLGEDQIAYGNADGDIIGSSNLTFDESTLNLINNFSGENSFNISNNNTGSSSGVFLKLVSDGTNAFISKYSLASVNAGFLKIQDGTGILLNTATINRLSINSAGLFNFQSNTLSGIGQLNVSGNGSAGSPSILFSSSSNVGLFYNAASSGLRISNSGGGTSASFEGSRILLNSDVRLGGNSGELTPEISGGTSSLGTSSLPWITTYTNQLNVDNLRLDGNTLSSTDNNGDVNISPDGTGDVVLFDGATDYQDFTNNRHSFRDGGTVDLILRNDGLRNSGGELVGLNSGTNAPLSLYGYVQSGSDTGTNPALMITGSLNNSSKLSTRPSIGFYHYTDLVGQFNASDQFEIFKTTNQLILGSTNTTTISSVAPSTSRTYIIPDFGSNDTFVGLAATQTLSNKTLSSPTLSGTMTGGAISGLTSLSVGGTGDFVGILRTKRVDNNQWIEFENSVGNAIIRNRNIINSTYASMKLVGVNDTGSEVDYLTINNLSATFSGSLTAEGDIIGNSGILSLQETTTPTATTNYGKVYTKSDNKLYFQDGAGTEHEIAFV